MAALTIFLGGTEGILRKVDGDEESTKHFKGKRGRHSCGTDFLPKGLDHHAVSSTLM